MPECCLFDFIFCLLSDHNPFRLQNWLWMYFDTFDTPEMKVSWNIVGKGETWLPAFSPFYTPIEIGTYYGMTRGIRAGGWVSSSSFSVAYLQNYMPCGYEILWVDRFG